MFRITSAYKCRFSAALPPPQWTEAILWVELGPHILCKIKLAASMICPGTRPTLSPLARKPNVGQLPPWKCLHGVFRYVDASAFMHDILESTSYISLLYLFGCFGNSVENSVFRGTEFVQPQVDMFAFSSFKFLFRDGVMANELPTWLGIPYYRYLPQNKTTLQRARLEAITLS